MEKYGIPLRNVYRHFDVTGKHCPSYLVNAQKWAEFKKRLEGKTMDNTPSPAHKEGVEWARGERHPAGKCGGRFDALPKRDPGSNFARCSIVLQDC